MAPITLNTLPFLVLQEVFLLLADHPGSLANLVRVDRTLYLIGLPFLYRSVSVTLQSLPLFVQSLTEENCLWLRSLSVFIRLPPVRSTRFQRQGRDDAPLEATFPETFPDFHQYSPPSLEGCIQMIIPQVTRMKHLRTFSFRAWGHVLGNGRRRVQSVTPCDTLHTFDIYQLIISLPDDCVELELDCTAPIEVYRNSSPPESLQHHCRAIQTVLPRLHHLRLRLSAYCDDLLRADLFGDVESKISQLKTVVIHSEEGTRIRGRRANACLLRDIRGTKPLIDAIGNPAAFVRHFPALKTFNIVSGGITDSLQLEDCFNPPAPSPVVRSLVSGNSGGTNVRTLPIRQIAQGSTLLVPFEIDVDTLDNGDHDTPLKVYARTRTGSVLYGHVNDVSAQLDESLWRTRASGSRIPFSQYSGPGLTGVYSGHSSSGLSRIPELCRNEALTGQAHLWAVEVPSLGIESTLNDTLPDGWELDPEYYADLANTTNSIRRVDLSGWTRAAP